jgi:hypothetical protein
MYMLKASLKSFGINIDVWEDFARDRTAWCTFVNTQVIQERSGKTKETQQNDEDK